MARKKKRIGTLDAETDPFLFNRTPEPFCWGFFDGDDYVDFWGDNSTNDLMDYLTDESDLIIYAHNGGKFDFFYLLPWLDEDIFMINGRIAKATLFDGRIELRDSWLILPMALKQMDKDDIDYHLFEREIRETHKKEILQYLKSDCVYLHNWVSSFIGRFGNGLTLAGTAFKELKKTGYEIGRTFEEYDSHFRQFYYGGRVQCFEVGEFIANKGETLLYVDINSAYPDAMMRKHWHGSKYIRQSKLPEGENGSWFATVKAISKGALPFRGDDGKLYFPVDGEPRVYKASGWEINSGIKTGTLEIIEVVDAYRPLHKSDFVEYVETFFKMKADAEAKGDPVARMFAKLMLNSCYGKFGQDGREFEKFAVCEFGQLPEGEGWLPYATTPTGEYIYSRPDPTDSFFNVCTAASITGYVRAFMWESLNKATRPLYCDTDSIICYDFAGDMGKELGEWDLEAEPVEAYIAQRKMYALKLKDGSTKVASKGVRLNFDEIKSGVLEGKIIKSVRDAPAFSLKYGARFFTRETNFENIEKNALTNPE